ncbi:sugar ABC transporter substrate-binding protein [Streptomyces sp. NBC_01218]|uniref:sugar ABC transporter substrate-binding protein n=1 Tax=unclassified Streptomyces TaxID=2593676 RepID=UPI0023B96ABD|nr:MULTISPECIES: sugar ABC transporter substrate-binding protein [unclassified Streptomyces]WEH38768.1 sugar ABC transporter substrate-binding protein [Streptomyces sp. AM 2-1-1]WSQ50428.1 sugar ABC transporter substrate-binding protein [Streptomyces sp. NBC_01218]
MSLSLHPRRVLATTVVGAALALGGCSGESGSGGDAVTLGFVNGGDTEFHTCLQKAVENTAEAGHTKIYTANSHQNPGTELSNIEDMISRNVDALIVQTVNVDALKGDIAKAKSAGIPIFLTSVVTDDPSEILGAVVVDLNAVGALDAGWVATDAAGRPVEVGVIAGAPGAASDMLVAGFTKALPATAKIVANQPGMFNAAKAKDVAENMIQAHPDLQYAFVANEEMALAARTAFKAAGKDVKIVTVNGTDRGLEGVEKGELSATVANSAMSTGSLAVNNAVGLLDKKKISKMDKTPILLVTKDNLDKAPQYCP